MANTTFLSLSGAATVATARKTALAECVLHLFQSPLIPVVTTTLAALEAVEATFDGYAAITIVAWTGPYLGPGTSWMILGGQPTFVWTFATGVGNTIGGTYIVDAAGNLQAVTVLNPTVPMQGAGQSLICNPFDVSSAG